jgi:murein L,D-transpeptidase YcbB/YkuD
MAAFLLRNDTTWTLKKVKENMNGGREKTIIIHPDVPVTIGYFTAWIDAEGNLNFRNDLYGHDKKMADKLFAKTTND